MTIAIADQPSPTRLRPSPEERPSRRPASAGGPLARPVPRASTTRGLASEHFAGGSRGVVPPGSLDLVAGGSRGVVPPGSNPVRACRMEPVTQSPASWRLTDRGIAVVLVLAAVIALAAVTVIGLTAWQVTGPGYQATGVAQLSQR
jgi:hypothetical protein